MTIFVSLALGVPFRQRRVSLAWPEINLIRVEKVLGIAPIDTLPHEDFEQVGIDVAVAGEFLHDLQSLRQLHAPLIGPVAGRECLEDVRDGHHARLQRHLLTRQAPWIALPIHALVMAAGKLGDIPEMPGPRQRFEHPDRCDDMMIDNIVATI